MARTFLCIGKEVFSSPTAAAPGGEKKHLLSSEGVIKNKILGLECQENSRRQKRPGLENNPEEENRCTPAPHK